MIIGKSLTALGGGGLKPEIIVTAKAGALLNLHYKGSSIILQSYQLGAEETQHTFVVSVNETAYVVEDATNGISEDIIVDTVAVFNVILNRSYIVKQGAVASGYTFNVTESNYSSSEYSVVSYNPLVLGRHGASWTRLYTTLGTSKYQNACISFSASYTTDPRYSFFFIDTSDDLINWTVHLTEMITNTLYQTEKITASLSGVSAKYIAIRVNSSTVGTNTSVTVEDFWLE